MNSSFLMGSIKTCAVLACCVVAGQLAAAPITFTSTINQPESDVTAGTVNGASSFTITEDSITATYANPLKDGNASDFGAAGGGLAVDDNKFEEGETFTLSFDQDVFLLSATMGTSTGGAAFIEIRDASDTLLITLDTLTAKGFAPNTQLLVGQSLTFVAADTSASITQVSRLRDITVEAVPEPASMLLVAAGTLAMLGRRKTA